MPRSEHPTASNIIPGPGSRPAHQEARAYDGPAQGQQWPVPDHDPPAWVELPVGAASALYRLVRHPGSHRPARDHLGNYLYVPMTGPPAAFPRTEQPQVIHFPAPHGGAHGGRHDEPGSPAS